jgi:hypothetical protein
VGITALAKKEQERKLAGKRGVANFLFVFICPAIPSLTFRLEVLPATPHVVTCVKFLPWLMFTIRVSCFVALV